MVGLIWTIQAVHYPLFHRVGTETFVGYEAEHTRRMGYLLAVPAAIEVATAGLLVWVRPATIDLAPVLIGGVILAAIWSTTALVQVPIHERLSRGSAPDVIDRLLRSNRWRTAGWTIRGALVAAMVFAAT